MRSRFIRVVADDSISFLFPWLILHCIYTLQFLYLFIDRGALRLFPYLGYCDHASMNMGVQVSFKFVFLFSSDKYPKVELLDPRGVLFLTLRGSSTPFSRVAAPTYIPASRAEGASILHILLDPWYFLSFR